MSLPDAPNTLREKYYSVMTGQNDADILPDIETAPSTENRYLDYMARHGGGGGGAVNSVNGQTGDVVLTASDVGALPDNTSIPSKTSDLTNDSNFVADASYVHTDSNYTATEKAKLSGIETNATANTVINTSCTLAANGWTGASAPYTQTVNVASILATDRAYVDLSVSSTTATGIDEIENWAYISKVESGTGTLTFTCYEDKPDIDLNVNVQVVRGSASGSNTGVTYSTDEAMTGDVWIDGKPIYRRTVQFTQWNQTINVSSWNIDTFFVDYAHSYFKGHVGTNPPYILPFAIVNAQADIYYDVTNTSIIWRSTGFTTNTFDAAYFTILYTKTTD